MSVNEVGGTNRARALWQRLRVGVGASEDRVRVALGVALVLAAALRVAISALSIGSDDARLWREFGKHIHEFGLVQTYTDRGDFNHPPLAALYGWFSYFLSHSLHLRFAQVFKAPIIASDALAAWLLWQIWYQRGSKAAAWVVVGFGFNLISISIGAYHGNTDCLLANLCLATAYAASRERWGWAGLLLGAAINVKLVPLMLVPVFALTIPSRRGLLAFGLTLTACALPFAFFAIFAWPELCNNVLSYNSAPFEWGASLFMAESRDTLPAFSTWLRDSYAPAARFVILGLMVVIGLVQRRTRHLDTFELGALALSTFLVLIPGFGVQYLAWPVPLLFAASPRWAVRYGLVGGGFAVLLYYMFWTGGRPWYSHFTMHFPPPATLVGLLAWGVLLHFTLASFRKLLGHRPAAQALGW